MHSSWLMRVPRIKTTTRLYIAGAILAYGLLVQGLTLKTGWAINIALALMDSCNEHDTIYAISSDSGDRMTMQSM